MTTRKRRATSWIDTSFSTFLGPGGAQFFASLIGGLTANDLAGATVTRMLLRMSFTYSATTPVDSVQGITVAIGMASREAFAASILPDSEVDGDYPERGWLYRDVFSYVQDSVNMAPAYHIREEVRSQRKLDNGQLYLALSNNDVSGTADSVQCRGLVRVLCLLS